MKSFIRALALCLCLLSTMGLTACATQDSDLPEGMQNATAHGADFRIYIPTTWNLNTAYGVSGGYFSLSNQSTVSATKYLPDAALAASLPASTDESGADQQAARIDAFFAATCKPMMERIALAGSLLEVAPAEDDLLNAVRARRYQYKYIVNGKDLRALHVIAERGGAFYAVSFIAQNASERSLYDQLAGDAERILDEFRFADAPYLADAYLKPVDTSAEAPEGMLLASNNDVAYRFYVPQGWTVDQNNAIFAAYLESDRSSVSVVPYLPETETMSVAEFWAQSVKQLKETDPDFDEATVKETKLSLDGRDATVYEYRYTVGEISYCYKQVVAAYKSMIYSITYTAATEEAYNAHLGDVDSILSAFRFR